ncbi:MAG: DUF3108 domain-containing protein [Endomicrobia bacterium]|nr:DUF3108 domain-containing protein [Endomicrobiia bacterium]
MLSRILIFIICFLINVFCFVYTDELAEIFNDSFFEKNTFLRNSDIFYDKDEILRYKIYWEFVYAGDAEMGIVISSSVKNTTYFIFTKSMSNPAMDLIYKVRNQSISYVDLKGFYSLKFISEQNEAGKFNKEYVLFDYSARQWIELVSNTTGYLENFVQDVVSSLWWLRKQNLKVQNKYSMEVYSGKIVYPMVVEVIKVQRVRVFEKEYECFKVEPKVDLKKFPLFKAKGRLFVYLTTDTKRLPVRLESKVFIGRVFADLIENN